MRVNSDDALAGLDIAGWRSFGRFLNDCIGNIQVQEGFAFCFVVTGGWFSTVVLFSCSSCVLYFFGYPGSQNV